MIEDSRKETVAGPGEIQVIGGVVKSITNKSGHYQPTEDEMAQVMREMEGRGVDLWAVEYVPIGHHFMGGINSKAPYPGGAKAFLDDHGVGGECLISTPRSSAT